MSFFRYLRSRSHTPCPCSSILMLLAVALGFGLTGNQVNGDDWLQWRGPDRADRSAEKGLLKKWDEGGPKQVWVYEQGGLGYAGFAVANDRLYTMGQEGDDEFALCLNAKTGEEIWRQPFGMRFQNGWGDGPRSTPTIDGDRLYCLSGSGSLACLKLSDGKVIWKKTMEEFGGKVPTWGYAESPLVDNKKVYCTPGGGEGAIMALDKMSGEKVWQCKDVTDEAHYSSIILAEINGSQQLIQLLKSQLVGIDAKSGELLWKYDWNGEVAVIPTPVYSDGIVYITSGYGVGSAAVKIGPDNKVEELFRNKVMKNHHGGVIEIDGLVFGYSDKVGFVCQKLDDGEMVWNDKNIVDKGAVSWADGMFYFLQEKDGQVFLLEADRDGMKEKGNFKLSPQSSRRSSRGMIWVHPVISNGRMFLRDQEFIYCFDVKS